ncbi:hypothetical protein ACFFMN_23600 [Planobispora siamensis]|uniref:Uncharacterized protein n=1 Tax=Planobispora siamensis TaxID=936338 RepID=A0A8J3SMV8_9ACTN|nr:hypothetical protein [Planobispora siamensis]GIH95350.1 hypothetical protein Psi01_59800 [Planobispora siamensis]
MPRFRHRIAVDFDKVVHTYPNGYGTGVIDGGLVLGAADALRTLMVDHDVFILTSRTDVDRVAAWITEKTQIPAIADLPGAYADQWGHGVLLVTNRKLPAVVYIDDRAVVFRTWAQTLADIAAGRTASEEPVNDTALPSRNALEEIRGLCDQEDPAAALEAIRGVLERTPDGKAPRSERDLETKVWPPA